jgi:hypothetical protein
LQQVERLEHIPNIGRAKSVARSFTEFGRVRAVDDDLTLVRQQDARDQVQQRALARAALAHQHRLFARAQFKLPQADYFQQIAVRFTEAFAQVQITDTTRLCQGGRWSATGRERKGKGGIRGNFEDLQWGLYDTTKNERHDGRNIRNRVELPLAGGAILLSAANGLDMVMVHRAEDNRHAEVNEQNNDSCKAILHLAANTLAAAGTKVKSLHCDRNLGNFTLNFL